jgi:hypothetical protein
LAGCINRGLERVKPELAAIRRQRTVLRAVAATLEQGGKSGAKQFDLLQEELAEKQDAVSRHMAKVMVAWSPGLFVGPKNLPADNLALERFFRLPKGHERRIHGHAHAGVRLVQEGPTLIPALDAHQLHPESFDVSGLLPYKDAQPPPCQTDAIRRRQIMRRARSKSQRKELLRELEKQYVDSG